VTLQQRQLGPRFVAFVLGLDTGLLNPRAQSGGLVERRNRFVALALRFHHPALGESLFRSRCVGKFPQRFTSGALNHRLRERGVDTLTQANVTSPDNAFPRLREQRP
jgi:hypothetical protein